MTLRIFNTHGRLNSPFTLGGTKMTEVIQYADVKSLLDRKDVDELIKVMKYGGTRAMQMDAAIALGMIGKKKAIEPLFAMINNPYTWIDIRTYAVQSIGRIGGEKAIEALNKAVAYKDFHGRSEDVEAIRSAAKTALHLVPPSKKWWKFWK